jgi:uncharacterized protein
LKKIPILYFSFFVGVLSLWLFYMAQNQLFYLIPKHFWAVLTMVFGSFIAGSSPEGSAAVAFPVFTLLLQIKPAVARNFAFAIQSIGMTSASLLIIGLKMKLEWRYIKFVTLGGVLGLLLGTVAVVPYISAIMAKLFFVSLWLSFGMVLFKENSKPNRVVYDSIQNFAKSDALKLLLFGFVGGVISSIFGTGINIFTFCMMSIYYGISEKIAVPSSIIIMSIETILGFFLHAKILDDFQPEAFEMWLACIPFVIVFAPLGSYVVSKLQRKSIANFLNIILVVQFFGAMWVIKPNTWQALICLVTIGFGYMLFRYLSAKSRAQLRP